MIYTEEKAKEIIEKYGLNPKTEKTWKSSGAIPDRYASESYHRLHHAPDDLHP